MKLRRLKNLWKEDSGATAIEYGLIVGLVSLAAVAVFMHLGTMTQSNTCSVNAKVIFAAEQAKSPGTASSAPGQNKC